MYREEAEEIEKPCVEYMLSLGWLYKKMDTGHAAKDWIDALFVGPNAMTIFVEFKKPKNKNGKGGGKLSPKQTKRLALLAAMGHVTLVIDNVDEFKEQIEELLL